MKSTSRLRTPLWGGIWLAVLSAAGIFGLTGCGGGGGSVPNCSLNTFAPNYGERIYFVHWTDFPVRIYFIRNENYTSELEDHAITGFNQWVTATGRKISYRIVDNLANAQITIQFDPSTSQGLTYVEYTSGSRKLRSAEVTIGIRSGNDVDYETVAAHELGHALGIVGIEDNPHYPGHSDDNDDLMYSSYTKGSPKFVTQRDLNTMKTAYCWLFENRMAPISRGVETIRRIKIECGN